MKQKRPSNGLIPHLQQSSYFYHRATVAQCLGNTFLAQNRLADAAPHLEESARLWRQFDDELMLANTLGTIAELYAQQGKADDAIAQFEQALALLAKYPDDAWAKINGRFYPAASGTKKRRPTIIGEISCLIEGPTKPGIDFSTPLTRCRSTDHDSPIHSFHQNLALTQLQPRHLNR
ncbi:MAG: tetratricopeptide repeat protein [Chloroflexi bacterium]|nr:tetratricopeptide repeat protein [Chloroflexota bacterium]